MLSADFIRREVSEKMLSAGAAAIHCEQDSALRSWGRFGKSAPMRTFTSVRLSTRFFRVGQSTSSVGLRHYPLAYATRGALGTRLLDVFSTLRFSSYRSLPPRPRLTSRISGS